MTAAEFRVAYPPFNDSTAYPDARVEYWLAFALKMVNSHRWRASGFQDEGQGLLCAHYLQVFEDRDEVTGAYVAPDGAAGAATGKTRTADGVSYADTYDASAYAGAGQLASTLYGQQFLDLRSLIGAGGIQL